jgi:hypothetical protein
MVQEKPSELLRSVTDPAEGDPQQESPEPTVVMDFRANWHHGAPSRLMIGFNSPL